MGAPNDISTHRAAELNVPQELVDAIVEQLQGDHATLRVCSLVCHSFHSPSRKLRFSRIVLDGSTFYQKQGCSVHNLLRILITSPDIAGHIRELEIKHTQGSITYKWLRDESLVKLLPLLHNLRSFSFSGYASRNRLSWQNIPPGLQSAIINILRSPTLTSLELADIQKVPLPLFEYCSSALKNLYVRRVEFTPSEATENILGPKLEKRVNLESLKLTSGPSDNMEHLIGWLCDPYSAFSVAHLQHLSATVINGDWRAEDNASANFTSVGRIARAAVTSLEHIDLVLPQCADESLRLIHLNHCHKLRTLSVQLGRLSIEQDRYIPEQSIFWFTYSLDSIPKVNRVEAITIAMYLQLYQPTPPVQGTILNSLVPVLARFPYLRQLKILLTSSDSSPTCLKILQADFTNQLSDIRKKGVSIEVAVTA